MDLYLPTTAAAMAAAFVITVLGASVQGTIGLGFAVVTVPILSLIDPVLAPVPQLLLALPLCASAAWREWPSAQLRSVGWILLGRIPGLLIGLALLKLASQPMLDLFIGSFVLFAAVVLAKGATITRRPRNEFLAGVLSGLGSLVSSMGGPPVGLLYQREKGPTIRATLSALFVIGIFMTVGLRWAADEIRTTDVQAACWLLPAVGLGFLLSTPMTRHLHGEALRWSVLGICSLAAFGLLGRAAVTL